MPTQILSIALMHSLLDIFKNFYEISYVTHTFTLKEEKKFSIKYDHLKKVYQFYSFYDKREWESASIEEATNTLTQIYLNEQY